MNIELMRKIDFWVGVPVCFLLSLWNGTLKLFCIIKFALAGIFHGKNRCHPESCLRAGRRIHGAKILRSAQDDGLRFEETTQGSVKKILFIKLSELGAILLAYPLMRKARDKYPDAEIYFLTFAKGKGVFKLLGGLCPDDHILTVRESAIFFLPDLIRALLRLGKERVDVSIDLEFFARVSAILSYFSGARKRVGFHRYDLEGLYRGNLLTHKVLYNPLQHVTRNYLALVQELDERDKTSPELKEGIAAADLIFPAYQSKPEIKSGLLARLQDLTRPENFSNTEDVSLQSSRTTPDSIRGRSGIQEWIPGLLRQAQDGEQSRTKARNDNARLNLTNEGFNLFGSQIYLMNPGEGMLPLREWPLENFIAVAQKILEQERNIVVLVGTEGAEGKTEVMRKSLQHPRCLSLVGQTNLEELMELFLISKALISNDCGLVHLAMLTSLQKYVFFGPESPAIFGPLDDRSHIFYSDWPCSPCLSALNHRKSSCRSNECLKVISVEQALRAIGSSG